MEGSIKSTILLVEDDNELREVVASALEKCGYLMLRASHGEEALEIVRETPAIGLVLSDIRMPGMNGMEMLKRIQDEIPNPPPVVLMTGFTDVIFSEALKAGAQAIVTKPFTIQTLLEKIESLLKIS